MRVYGFRVQCFQGHLGFIGFGVWGFYGFRVLGVSGFRVLGVLGGWGV